MTVSVANSQVPLFNVSNSNRTAVAATTFTTTIGNMVVAAIGFTNIDVTGPSVSSISVPAGETASWVKLSAHAPTRPSSAGTAGELWAITPKTSWPTGTSLTVSFTGTAGSTFRKICILGELVDSAGTLDPSTVHGAGSTTYDGTTGSSTANGTATDRLGDVDLVIETQVTTTALTANTSQGYAAIGQTGNGNSLAVILCYNSIDSAVGTPIYTHSGGVTPASTAAIGIAVASVGAGGNPVFMII